MDVVFIVPLTKIRDKNRLAYHNDKPTCFAFCHRYFTA